MVALLFGPFFLNQDAQAGMAQATANTSIKRRSFTARNVLVTECGGSTELRHNPIAQK